jgi:hypothetical protein
MVFFKRGICQVSLKNLLIMFVLNGNNAFQFFNIKKLLLT